MKVPVTKRHITNGCRNNCYACPIALAIMDATGCDSVIVDEESVCYSYNEDDGKTRKIYHKLPLRARRFIDNYDNLKSVNPFKFILSEKTKCH